MVSFQQEPSTAETSLKSTGLHQHYSERGPQVSGASLWARIRSADFWGLKPTLQPVCPETWDVTSRPGDPVFR